MSSRNRIIEAIANNQPPATPLPDISVFTTETDLPLLESYETILAAIGGKSYRVNSYHEIKAIIKASYGSLEKRILNLVPELEDIATAAYEVNPAAHHLADVELAVLKAHFGIAENGSVWITEDLTGHRAVPFICQHLAVVIDAKSIVPDMHQAYRLIANADYGFSTFIAGPSKTADIEQSLVLGAHGPRSMTVFCMM